MTDFHMHFQFCFVMKMTVGSTFDSDETPSCDCVPLTSNVAVFVDELAVMMFISVIDFRTWLSIGCSSIIYNVDNQINKSSFHKIGNHDSKMVKVI